MRFGILMLAMVGCSSSAGTTYRVEIDPSMSADDVTMAMSRWTGAVPQLILRPVIATCDWQDHTICVVSGTLPPTKLGHTEYFYRSDRAVTTVDDAQVASECGGCSVDTIAHELGHAMGLLHPHDWNGTTGDGTMMYPYYGTDRSATVTPTDVAQFWSIR